MGLTCEKCEQNVIQTEKKSNVLVWTEGSGVCENCKRELCADCADWDNGVCTDCRFLKGSKENAGTEGN